MAIHPLKHEFKELYRVSGWSQAEVARRLHMTRGGVNGIVTGDTVPSPATVDLFKRVLLSEKPGALKAESIVLKESLPEAGPGRMSAGDIADAIEHLSKEEREKLAEIALQAMQLISSVRLRRTNNPNPHGNPSSSGGFFLGA